MTEHLSECFASLCECDDTHFKSIDCDFSCICPSLRACEQRVLTDLVPNLHLAEMQGYNRALTAAREAVAGIQDGPKNQPYWIDREAALTAIDALRIDTPKQQVMEHINLAVVEDA